MDSIFWCWDVAIFAHIHMLKGNSWNTTADTLFDTMIYRNNKNICEKDPTFAYIGQTKAFRVMWGQWTNKQGTKKKKKNRAEIILYIERKKKQPSKTWN